jgi:glycosyltransferase involved in cell wall biosynthesis
VIPALGRHCVQRITGNFFLHSPASMKSVLVIAYYFPPSGGPGVQRVLKHIQYLPEFGWKPIVLTVENGDFPARDESLLAQIPPGIIVERTHIYEPYDLYRMLMGHKKGAPIDVNVIKKDDQKRSFKEQIAEAIRATLFIPDARIGWLPTAIPKAMELVRKHRIDAIYNSSPPYTTSLIARAVKRRTGLPWITGFRDPWTGFISSPKRWFLPARIDRRMEYSVFREANAVECAWQGIIKDIRGKFPDLPADKFHHVPNGYDSADYPDINDLDKSLEVPGKFTLTYTGSMYGRRNPAALFQALELLIRNKEIDAGNIHLRFIGRFGAEIYQMFQDFSNPECIEVIGYVPHEKSIHYLMASDILLLIVDESKESAEIVPGKVYEYIGSMKPVLAIAPEQGAIAELMQETRAGGLAHQSDIPKLARIIKEMYIAWLHGHPLANPDIDAIRRYERRESTHMLASLLDQASARK